MKREVEKILESEEQQEQIEGLSQTEKVERVRRLSEGLDDEPKDDSIEEPKSVKITLTILVINIFACAWRVLSLNSIDVST